MEDYKKYYKYLSDEELPGFNELDDTQKINCLLLIVMYDEKFFDIDLIKELMLKIYSKNEVDFFISVLECKTLEDEEKLIKKFSSDKYDCEMFLQKGFSTFWRLGAKILKNKPYEVLNKHLDNLFEWLQDANWLGFSDVEDILLSIPEDDFILGFKKHIKRAKRDFDAGDLDWMDNLIELFRERGISIDKIDDEEIRDILKKYI